MSKKKDSGTGEHVKGRGKGAAKSSVAAALFGVEQWPMWLRLPREVESMARHIVSERQDEWDRFSADGRKHLESWDHFRPTEVLVERTRKLMEVIAGALYTGRKDTLDRMLEATDLKRSSELARGWVVKQFIRALDMQPNGTIGTRVSEIAVLHLLQQLPQCNATFGQLTQDKLVRLLSTGRLSDGRRRNSKVSAFLLAAEASQHCGAFGDDQRSVEQARDDFRRAYEKFRV